MKRIVHRVWMVEMVERSRHLSDDIRNNSRSTSHFWVEQELYCCHSRPADTVNRNYA